VSAFEISLIVLACVFGGAMLGLHLKTWVPEHHLSSDSKDVIKLATGIIATMAALLLGLLISSAKSSFDQFDHELIIDAARVVLLDRTLAEFGPETRDFRDLLKSYYTSRVDLVTSGNDSRLAKLGSSKLVNEMEGLRARIRQLSPGNDAQHLLQTQALQIADELVFSRWLLLLEKDNSVSMTLVWLLVVWLSMVFAAFGMLAPRNHTVVAALFMSTLAVSGAIFMILELNAPLTGLIRISNASMLDAAAHLGQ